MTQIFLCSAAVLCLWACSSDSADSENGVPIAGNESVTAIVDAARGATLALEDGTSVTIPPGALKSDAQISLSRETCDGVYASERFDSCRYRVSGPDEELDGRYALSIASHGGFSGESCAAALTEDGWRCLVDTEASEQRTAATASVFGDFTVRAASGDIEDDRCTDAPLKPCGGDLVGKWTLIRACGSMEDVLGVSFTFDRLPYEACDPFDHSMEFPFSVDGSLDFGQDGTLHAIQSFEISSHTLVTEACLAEVGEECGADCILEDGVCECVSFKSEGQSGSGDDWSLGGGPGTFLYFDQPFQYCVEGERLTVEFPGHSGESHLRVYERAAPDLLPVGTAGCVSDEECEEGLCWDLRDHDPACAGTICSRTCETNFDCQAVADEAGGLDPSVASCGTNGQCDLVGTGLGSFSCE